MNAIFSGIDLVEIERFEGINPSIRERFFRRVFTMQELKYINDQNQRAAGIFTAKEAAAKALGCGIGQVKWQDIEVTHSPERRPIIVLHGRAEELAAELGIVDLSVSITHTKTTAAAVVFAIA